MKKCFKICNIKNKYKVCNLPVIILFVVWLFAFLFWFLFGIVLFLNILNFYSNYPVNTGLMLTIFLIIAYLLVTYFFSLSLKQIKNIKITTEINNFVSIVILLLLTILSFLFLIEIITIIALN